MELNDTINGLDYSGNFSNDTTTGTGAGGGGVSAERFATSGGCSTVGTKPAARLSSMAAAFDDAISTAIAVAGGGGGGGGVAIATAAASFDGGRGGVILDGGNLGASEWANVASLAAAGRSASPSAEDDYKLCDAKATALNCHLMANGCASGYRHDGWEPKFQDAIQAAMLDLQLWRRGLKVVRDALTGAEKIEPDFSKIKEIGVVWRGLRRGLRGCGYSTSDTGMEFAGAFEAWRQDCNEGGNLDGESTEERTARRLAALRGGVLDNWIAQAGTGAGPLKNARLAKRRALAAKVETWTMAVLTGEGLAAAAEKASIAGSESNSALQYLIHTLRKAGLNIADGSWRNQMAQGPRRTAAERAAAQALNEAIRAKNAVAKAARRVAAEARKRAGWKAQAARISALRAARRAADAPRLAAERAARKVAARARANERRRRVNSPLAQARAEYLAVLAQGGAAAAAALRRARGRARYQSLSAAAKAQRLAEARARRARAWAAESPAQAAARLARLAAAARARREAAAQ